MKKRLRYVSMALCLSLAVLIALVLSRRIRETQAFCDAYMATFTPPLPHNSTRFTLFLDNHPTAGEWPGFKPGWIIDYRNTGQVAGVTYYVNLSGDIVHSEPVNWLGALWKHMKEESEPTNR